MTHCWPSIQADSEILRKRIAPALRLRMLRARLVYLFSTSSGATGAAVSSPEKRGTNPSLAVGHLVSPRAPRRSLDLPT